MSSPTVCARGLPRDDDRAGLHSRVPAQGVWHLGPVPIRAYALCIIVGHRRGADASVTAGGGARRRAGRHLRHRVVGGAVRSDRRPALSRHDRLADVLREHGGAGFGAALRIWDGGLRHLGCGGARRCRCVDRLPAARAFRCPRSATRSRRESSWRRRSAGWATTSTRSCTGGRRRCRGAWRSTNAATPPGVGSTSLNGVSTGELVAVVHPTFLYELLWNLLIFALLIWVDRRFKLGHGTVVRALCRRLLPWPVLDRADAQRRRDA